MLHHILLCFYFYARFFLINPNHFLLPSRPINQANSQACQGKYVAGSIPSFAANASLFVAGHKY